jgi:SNF2 family DNA or RNA helicase
MRDSVATVVVTFAVLLVLISQLRKVCNHPKQILYKRDADRILAEKRAQAFLNSEVKPREPALEQLTEEARQAEEELRGLTGEALVKSSGKLALLDRLLLKLRAQGSRVLIFSQVRPQGRAEGHVPADLPRAGPHVESAPAE